MHTSSSSNLSNLFGGLGPPIGVVLGGCCADSPVYELAFKGEAAEKEE